MLGTDGEVLLLVDLGLGLVALPDDLVVAALVDNDRAQLALVPLLPQTPGKDSLPLASREQQYLRVSTFLELVYFLENNVLNSSRRLKFT